MDHPCHKCGHNIEDGKAFCSQCGAPQIRVAIAEAPAEPAPAGDGTIPSLGFDDATPLRLPASVLASSRSHALRPCALAAVVGAVPMLLGLNPFFAALGTGVLAVAFSRRSGETAMRPATGAMLGALSGVLLFGFSAILETLAVALLHKGAEVRSEMIDKVQQAAARYPGPDVQTFLDFVKSPTGFAIMMVASLIAGLVAFVVLGGCGGALAAAFWGRRRRP
jgi:Mn2+/Fe2+ NRAMP family transporter